MNNLTVKTTDATASPTPSDGRLSPQQSRSPNPPSPSNEKEEGGVHRFLTKIKSGLKARKFNQSDPKAEASFKKFMESTSPVMSHTAKFTPDQVDLVNAYILRVRNLLYSNEQEKPDEWPTPDYTKKMPSDFLQVSIQALPTHVEKCAERLKEQTKAIVLPQAGSSSASLKSKIASSLQTEIHPLQRAVELPKDVPEPFWETLLGKAFKDLRKALVLVRQDLKEAEDKLNKATAPSQNEPATGALTTEHQDSKKADECNTGTSSQNEPAITTVHQVYKHNAGTSSENGPATAAHGGPQKVDKHSAGTSSMNDLLAPPTAQEAE